MVDHMVDDEVEDDELIDQVFSYLVSNEYPNDASEYKKGVIRKKAKKFLVIKGELFYRHFTKISSFVEGTWLLTVSHLVTYVYHCAFSMN